MVFQKIQVQNKIMYCTPTTKTNQTIHTANNHYNDKEYLQRKEYKKTIISCLTPPINYKLVLYVQVRSS